MQGEYPAGDGVRLRRACDGKRTALGSARLFACAWCGREVVLCSCCDRGQIYCDGDCAGQARRQTLRGAGRRCQQTRRGRRMHAARMARYRAKLASLACSLAQSSAGAAMGTPDEGWPRNIEIVTHHGSPQPPAGDLVAAGATTMPRDDASPAEPPGPAMSQCHWCGRCCLLPLRRGFLRRCDHRRGRVGQVRREYNRHGDRD